MALSFSTVLVAAGVGAFGVLSAATSHAAPTPTPVAAATPVIAAPVLASFTTNDSDWRRFRCDDWWHHRDDRCFRDDFRDHRDDFRDHRDDFRDHRDDFRDNRGDHRDGGDRRR